MKRFSQRFQGIYWRQLFMTTGIVLLTLFLLGASFFLLSYNYARQERTEELKDRATVVARLSATYLRDNVFSSREEFLELATFGASVSEMGFLICDCDGRALLTTEEVLAGKIIVMPEKLVQTALTKGESSGVSDLDGMYDSRHFVVGVPVTSTDGQNVGVVFALAETTYLDVMWRGFVGLFFMTAMVVLMVSFMAASITAMRVVKPIREMAQATRRYAEGNFDIRMYDYGRSDEIGELAASFNNMAESLQETERQRREFIANISHELKTPMTTIAGYTDGILDGTIPPENQRRYLEIISAESRRLSRLVRRMLDVSQLQTIEPMKVQGRFDLSEVVRRVLISL